MYTSTYSVMIHSWSGYTCHIKSTSCIIYVSYNSYIMYVNCSVKYVMYNLYVMYTIGPLLYVTYIIYIVYIIHSVYNLSYSINLTHLWKWGRSTLWNTYAVDWVILSANKRGGNLSKGMLIKYFLVANVSALHNYLKEYSSLSCNSYL